MGVSTYDPDTGEWTSTEDRKGTFNNSTTPEISRVPEEPRPSLQIVPISSERQERQSGNGWTPGLGDTSAIIRKYNP